MKGKFITFEGCEGVGKSRQIKLLEEYLIENGIKYFLTREPGGNAVSEQIRKIILDGNNTEMTDRCEALLYAASRAQIVSKVILPRINAGELVFCDRFVDSSLAYQGKARNLGYKFIEEINSFVFKSCMPDLTLFLDLSPEMAFKRKGGVDKTDRLETSGSEFHDAVYKGYLELAEKYKDRIVRIDAKGTKEETHLKIIQALKDKGII